MKFIRFASGESKRPVKALWASSPTTAISTTRHSAACASNLMQAFNEIYVLDLHGNAKKKERAPDGGKDENVFDIQQGVAITFLRQTEGNRMPGAVLLTPTFGAREWKYDRLAEGDISQTEWTELKPSSPFYLFVPQECHGPFRV